MPPKHRRLTSRAPPPISSVDAADRITNPVKYLHEQLHSTRPDYRVKICGTAKQLRIVITHQQSESTTRWQWTYSDGAVADEEDAAYRQALALLFEDGIIPPYTHCAVAPENNIAFQA